MLITCENCQTQYTLDPAKLSPGGHRVRCTKCLHIWFVAPEGDIAPELPQPAAPEFPAAEETFQPADGEAWSPQPEETAQPERNVPTTVDAIPSSLKNGAAADGAMPVVDHNPGGMGATQFGLFTFLLLVFATIIGLFLGRGYIIQHWPAMSALYDRAGLGVPVPGEGLKLLEMTTQQQGSMLTVKARVSNMSASDMAYPSLTVILRGPYGAALKEWTVPAEDVTLKAGDSAPVSLTFDDAPEGGDAVDLKVAGHK